MRNIRLVIRHEIAAILGTRSFWTMTFLFPLFVLGLTLLPQLAARQAFQGEGVRILSQLQREPAPVAYVDLAGVIVDAPGVDDLPPDARAAALQPFADEAAAHAALTAGRVDQYYVIPADYRRTGRLILVGERITPLADLRGASLLERAVNANLLGDPALAALVADPTGKVEERALQPAPSRPEPSTDMSNFAMPFAVMFLLFLVITISGGYMLQSVTKEKQNRTAEILLTSLRPADFMAGKLIGLGVVALLQMAVWAAGSLILFRGNWAGVAEAAQGVSPAFLAWTAVYLLLGYIVYASALGALGALAPGMREGSQLTIVLLLPLLVPLILAATFIEAPNGPLATALSLFPLTAPTSMVTRMSAAPVPVWQPILGLALLAATAYLFVILAARFFRAENLVSDANLSWPRIRAALRR
jgi:ABC-2 type transport system permease protein